MMAQWAVMIADSAGTRLSSSSQISIVSLDFSLTLGLLKDKNILDDHVNAMMIHVFLLQVKVSQCYISLMDVGQ